MRTILHLLAFAPGLLSLTIIAPSILAADKRPNIIFAFADDWGRYASVYAKVDGPGSANDVIKTPNFDRIARERVLFKHAFVAAPSCTPSRSSLLSGQYFWRTGLGAILGGARWDPTIPSFPFLLRDAGYHIGQTYKVWSPGTPIDAPYGGDATGYEKAGIRFPRFSLNTTAMIQKGMPVEAAKQVLYDEVKANFRRLSRRPKARPTVLLLVRAASDAPQMDQRFGQDPVGHRSRAAQGQATQVPARCTRGP
jgi:arylsulfatase A-like enzyme